MKKEMIVTRKDRYLSIEEAKHIRYRIKSVYNEPLLRIHILEIGKYYLTLPNLEKNRHEEIKDQLRKMQCCIYETNKQHHEKSNKLLKKYGYDAIEDHEDTINETLPAPYRRKEII